jgi:hypothetical protein
VTNAVKAPNPQRERQRKWYRSLSPDQLTARRIRQAEQQRIRREKQKEGIYTPRKRTSADERRERLRIYNREWQRQKRTALKTANSPLQPVSESTAPMRLRSRKRSLKPTLRDRCGRKISNPTMISVRKRPGRFKRYLDPRCRITCSTQSPGQTAHFQARESERQRCCVFGSTSVKSSIASLRRTRTNPTRNRK